MEIEDSRQAIWLPCQTQAVWGSIRGGFILKLLSQSGSTVYKLYMAGWNGMELGSGLDLYG